VILSCCLSILALLPAITITSVTHLLSRIKQQGTTLGSRERRKEGERREKRG